MTARAEWVQLSDGSEAWDVELEAPGFRVRFGCSSEAAARRLVEELEASAWVQVAELEAGVEAPAPVLELSDGSRVLEAAADELGAVLEGCRGGPADCLPVLFKGSRGWRCIGWGNSLPAADAVMASAGVAARCVSLAVHRPSGRSFYALHGRP